MKRSTGTAAVALAVGGFAAGRLLSRRHARVRDRGPARVRRGRQSRWHSVTVNRPQREVAPRGKLPEPLNRLGSSVEVRLRPAPASRGTELAARPRPSAGFGGLLDPARGGRQARAVRAALREAKQLVETGEVPRPNAPSTTGETRLGRPLGFATGSRRGRL